MFGIQASLPRVGHVKAIDVFLMGSFIFVFAALVEYAIICTFSNLFSSGANPNLKGYFQRRVTPTMIFEENENLEVTSGESDTFHQVFERKQVEFQVNVLLFLELLRELLGKTVPIGFFHPFTPTQILAQSPYCDSNFRAIPSSRPNFSRIQVISTHNFRAIPSSQPKFSRNPGIQMAILDTPLYVEPKNLQFPPLGETKSIPVTFIWEFPTYPREIAAEK